MITSERDGGTREKATNWPAGQAANRKNQVEEEFSIGPHSISLSVFICLCVCACL